MRLTDRSVWTAPPPNAVRQATAQPVNPQAGLAIYFYWIVAHYPIGKIVSEPFQVSRAPMPITAQNAVFLSWEAAPTATSYDILRTTTPQLPTDGTPFGLALGLPATTTTYLDQLQTLFAYDTTELMHGSPVDGWALMNNKDFQEPVLELWPTVSISKIIFADGSQQDSAGGGVISGVASVFGRTGHVVAQYGDYNASQIPLLPPIGSWTNVYNALQSLSGLWQQGSGGAIYYNGGHVGIGTSTPGAKLSVVNDSAVGATGLGINSTRYANDSIAPEFYSNKARGTQAAPLPVQVGDFIGYFGFGGYVSGVSYYPDGANINVIVTGVTSTDIAADLIFATNPGNLDNNGNAVERMRIDSLGNIIAGDGNLYWDNILGRLAIGSGTLIPSAELVVTSQESTVGVITAGRFTNDNLPPGVYQYKSRGTLAAPLAVQPGDFIYRLHYAGNTGAVPMGNQGSISAIMTSPTLADMLFYTNDGTDLTGDGIVRMRITAQGQVIMYAMPTSPSGLASGTLWNNGGIVNIVP